MNRIYLRTSTREQNTQSQLDQITTMVDRVSENHNARVYEEQESAWNTEKNRPVFSRLCKEVEEGDNIFVWDLDRLYRNRVNLKTFFEWAKHKRIKIYSYRQAFLLEINRMPDPWNDIVFDMLVQVFGWIAEEESTKKSERIKKSIKKTSKGTYSHRGKRWGRKRNYSLKTKKRIQLLRAEGKSYRVIADQMNRWEKGNAKKISKSAVERICKEVDSK